MYLVDNNVIITEFKRKEMTTLFTSLRHQAVD